MTDHGWVAYRKYQDTGSVTGCGDGVPARPKYKRNRVPRWLYLMTNIKPGDVLAIRSGGSAAWWIRFGAALRDKPNMSNHIAVVHHIDPKGTVWGIEGRPGGVGWVDCAKYLKSPQLLTNAEQPKTGLQRATVCKTMEALLGTPYDWQAIIVDGAEDLGVKVASWSPDWKTGEVPGHVVCSSLADYAYFKAGLACPIHGREVQPSDWDAFILAKGWEVKAK